MPVSESLTWFFLTVFQNVYVQRGPVQWLFGISTIVVETAGAAEGEGDNQFAVGNKAIMEGIDNPDEIRGLIMERVQRSKLAGLGDEGPSAPASRTWSAEHLRVLRQILEEASSTTSVDQKSGVEP